MTSGPQIHESLHNALLAGVRQFARLLWGADTDTCEDLISGRFFTPFHDLETHIDELRVVVERLQQRMMGYPDAAALCTDLEADYVRLFINSRDGIVAPLYESCYVDGTAQLMGPPALRMKERLDAHQLAVGSHLPEPPDHIAVELEYLYFLLEKGFRENQPPLIEEARSFCLETLHPWAALLYQRLAAHEAEGFYSDFTGLLCSLLRWVGDSLEG